MDISSQVSTMTSSMNEWLSGQEWYQQLKAKWDELDPQSKSYLQITGVVGGTLLALYMVLSFIWGVHKLKQEVTDKSTILMSMQSANDELKALQSVNSTLASGGAATNDPWPPYFEGIAAPVGIAKGNITVSDPKAGTANDISKEAMFDISLRKVNLHQMVRFAYGLESGTRPVKLRDLSIDTAPDMSGYLDATLTVSAFTQLNANTPSGK